LVRVVVELFPDGCLASFRAEGHAGETPRGANIACAAATQMLRTAARILYTVPGLVTGGDAETPGVMGVEVSRTAIADRQWLRGVTDFLLRGLRDLAAEFPRQIDVSVK
jgi:uncharacterized protein YsxB (DUF464 family)